MTRGRRLPCAGRDEADLAAIVTLAARDGPDAAARAAHLVPPAQRSAVIAAAARLGCLLEPYRPAQAGGPTLRDARFRSLH